MKYLKAFAVTVLTVMLFGSVQAQSHHRHHHFKRHHRVRHHRN